MTITGRISVSPGNCGGNYSITFVVKNPPGGAVTLTYTWNLPNGQSVTEKPVTLKAGTTSFTDYIASRSLQGNVTATWNAVGSPSDSVPVTIECIT